MTLLDPGVHSHIKGVSSSHETESMHHSSLIDNILAQVKFLIDVLLVIHHVIFGTCSLFDQYQVKEDLLKNNPILNFKADKLKYFS